MLLYISLFTLSFPLVAFSCSEGEFLDMQKQQCQKCAAGTYSLGTGVAFEEWDSLPSGFVTHGVNTNSRALHADCSKFVHGSFFILKFHALWSIKVSSDCFCWCFSSSTWTPKGDHIASNTNECTSTLSYAVSLKKPGVVSFEYFYPENSIYFEFFVSDLKMTVDIDEGGFFQGGYLVTSGLFLSFL